MTERRAYSVDPGVLGKARELGLYGNLEGRIVRMARNAAPFTHAEANRRYHDFLFKIEGGTIVDIMKYDPATGEIRRNILERPFEKGFSG